MVTINDDIMIEILSRTKLGWQAFRKMNTIFKSNMPICLKRKVFNQWVLLALVYGCETWTLGTKAAQKLKVTQ